METFWKEATEKGKKGGRSFYVCCCGVSRWVSRSDVKSGKSKSCGCVSRASSREARLAAVIKHGKTDTPEWVAWVELRRRCRVTNRHDSRNYGIRGISYNPSWEVFDVFLSDMGPRPDGCSLDRIDNSKGYSKDNCRWATRKEQERNKRSNRLITIFCEQIPVAQACEFFAVPSGTVYQRLNRGWPPEKALLQW